MKPLSRILSGRWFDLLTPTPRSLTHTLHSLTHSLTYSLTHSLTHALTHPLTHSLAHSFTHSLTHSLTRSLIHSLPHSLSLSLTHSLTHSLARTCSALSHSLTVNVGCERQSISLSLASASWLGASAVLDFVQSSRRWNRFFGFRFFPVFRSVFGKGQQL